MKDIKLKKLLKDQFNLKNKKVIITGGGGFLAFYFASAVAEFGAIPILIDFNEKQLNKNLKNLKKKIYCIFVYL